MRFLRLSLWALSTYAVLLAPQVVGGGRYRLGTAKPHLPSLYANPVIDRDFPDPSVLKEGGTFYAYATNSGPNMLCARSADLVHWTLLPDALPRLPDWARPGRTWAPDVCAFTPGHRYVAYFAASNRVTGQECIDLAIAPCPQGPFVPLASKKPLVEQAEIGGAIDPSCFTDSDGRRYLLWKNDGNSCGRDTWLWLQKLSDDGIRLQGAPMRLIKQDQAWEGSLVEAPLLWKHDGRYYLFYSANGYNTCRYAVSYAVANSLRGPYVKPRSTPWFSTSTANACGPGGEAIIGLQDGTTGMVYHTWAHGPGSYRSMNLGALTWDKEGPHLRVPALLASNEPSPSE